MKAWYRSKKLWSAVFGALLTLLTTYLTVQAAWPTALVMSLAGSLTTIFAALVVAIGLADFGKEAKAIDEPSINVDTLNITER